MADLKDLNRRLYKEVFENRNVEAVDDLATVDMVDHEEPPPGLTVQAGREGVKQVLAAFVDAFDPLRAEVHEQYQDGDTVISRVTFHGTHVGDFAGVPASGKSFSVGGIDIIRYEGDRAAEHWGQMDTAALLAQLGVLPSPE